MSKNNEAFDKGFEKYSPLTELILLKYVILQAYLWSRILNRYPHEEHRTPALETRISEMRDETQMGYSYALTT